MNDVSLSLHPLTLLLNADDDRVAGKTKEMQKEKKEIPPVIDVGIILPNWRLLLRLRKKLLNWRFVFIRQGLKTALLTEKGLQLIVLLVYWILVLTIEIILL